MTQRQRLIYGAVMAAVVFFVGLVLQVGGALWVNALFALAMGGFAYIATGVAGRLSGREKE